MIFNRENPLDIIQSEAIRLLTQYHGKFPIMIQRKTVNDIIRQFESITDPNAVPPSPISDQMHGYYMDFDAQRYKIDFSPDRLLAHYRDAIDKAMTEKASVSIPLNVYTRSYGRLMSKIKKISHTWYGNKITDVNIDVTLDFGNPPAGVITSIGDTFDDFKKTLIEKVHSESCELTEFINPSQTLDINGFVSSLSLIPDQSFFIYKIVHTLYDGFDVYSKKS